jgi:UDP-4-amino-4,6-dideoxy-N-acetyl-beta-L-altrosamine transaminase
MNKNIIPYGRQSIDNRDIKNVVNVLKSDFLTSGPIVEKFEKEIKKYCNSKFSVSANSATSALHIACLALGLSKGDILWTTPITFVASANCALYCNAKVDFVDIDSKTFNLSVSNLEKKLISAKKKGKLPKILIPTHLGGQSCEMDKIKQLSKKYHFSIIEDASHALGGKYKMEKVGNSKYSDITVFSFHPIKSITTAEGGIALTNNKNLAVKMKMYREHGIVRDPKKFKGKIEGPWVYQQQELGYNYRLSDVHAALGIGQLKRLNKFLIKRNQISLLYKKRLKELPIRFQENQVNIYSAKHLFIILVDKKIHLKLFKYLKKKKILVNIHYIPIFLHPYFKSQNFNIKNYENSMNYYKSAMSLPIHYVLTKKQQLYVITVIKSFYKNLKIK